MFGSQYVRHQGSPGIESAIDVSIKHLSRRIPELLFDTERSVIRQAVNQYLLMPHFSICRLKWKADIER